MSQESNNALGINEDHVGGYFEWEVEPNCSCGQLKQAVEDQFVFVSNFVSDGYNSFYIMPLEADGSLFRSDGLQISHCPWCGDEIRGAKRYPLKK